MTKDDSERAARAAVNHLFGAPGSRRRRNRVEFAAEAVEAPPKPPVERPAWSEPVLCQACGFDASQRHQGGGLDQCEDCCVISGTIGPG